MRLTVRDWKESDAVFVCWMRNNPALNKWYRQAEPIRLKDQKKFQAENSAQIVELDNKPIGVLWTKPSGELSLVMEEKDYKYIPRLFKKRPRGNYWGEVFMGNPILKYLLEAGFQTVSVKERAYYKDGRLMDIVRCEY